MQRRISSLPLFHFVIFFVLLAPPCLANSDLKISRVVYVSELKTWTAARNYCRANYKDLVTFRNTWESSMFDMYEGWIGLFIEVNGVWKWSTDSDEQSKVQWCIFKNGSNWEVDRCSHSHPFMCIDERLTLVQKVKTWEEALHYCRGLHAVGQTPANTTLVYDLASLPEAGNILLNTTDEIWVGLRFLADEWVWMSGEAVTGSYLPHCPARDQHCGAMDQNSTEWKLMNCSERRNFLCSIKLERL